MFKIPLIPSTEIFPADSMLTIADGPVVGNVPGGIVMVRSTLALLDPAGNVTLVVKVLVVFPAIVVVGDEALLVCVGINVLALGVDVA